MVECALFRIPDMSSDLPKGHASLQQEALGNQPATIVKNVRKLQPTRSETALKRTGMQSKLFGDGFNPPLMGGDQRLEQHTDDRLNVFSGVHDPGFEVVTHVTMQLGVPVRLRAVENSGVKLDRVHSLIEEDVDPELLAIDLN